MESTQSRNKILEYSKYRGKLHYYVNVILGIKFPFSRFIPTKFYTFFDKSK